MAFRRGFKSQCERRAVEIRKDLKLTKLCPLNAFDLAKHYGVIVWSTSDIIGMTKDDLAHLTIHDGDCWSALTMRMENHHLIIYKDITSLARINSVVMHEMSHIILGHELAEACMLSDGSMVPSNFSQDQEDEADWLAGTFLLPRPALLDILSTGIERSEAKQTYQVSEQMLEYRMRMTGVRHQIRHRRAKI